MTETKSLFFLAGATLALLVGACAAEDGARDDAPGGASGKADELDGETEGEPGDLAHRDAVITCDELATRVLDRTNVERVEEVVDVERGRQNCLVGANDAVIDVIDNALSNVSSPEAGRTSGRFDALRAGGQDVCNNLVEASDGALDKSGAVFSQRCTADAERQLSDLIDAHVALGIDPISIPESRPLYDACYVAFDDAGETAVGHADEIIALQDLSACIVEENDAMRLRIIERIIASFPGRAPADLEDETYRYFRVWHDAGEDICTGLSQAGEATDDAFVERQLAECMVAADTMLGELSASVVPELFDATTAGDGGGSTGGGSGDGDSGGGSSTGA